MNEFEKIKNEIDKIQKNRLEHLQHFKIPKIKDWKFYYWFASLICKK